MKKFYLLSVMLLLPLLASAQKYPVDTIKYMGSLDNYVNLVFLGDGYRESEMNTFVQDVRSATNAFFQITPWKNYKDYINVFLIKTPSQVSGAGLTPSSAVNNFYGTTFGYGGIDRLLYPKSLTKVRQVLSNNFPKHNIVVMVVNSTKYGGAGGEIMTYSKASQALEIFFHEVGHGFANLADEYWAEGYQGEKPNMTRTSSTQSVKWKNWCGTESVSVYPYPENRSWYRPHQNCKMQYLGREFCAVCRQAIIESIHKIVNPINSYQPSNRYSVTVGSSRMDFRLDLIKPNPNTLEVTWKLNGSVIGTGQDAVSLTSNSLTGRNDELVASVEDKTSYLRVDNHSSVHAYSVRWQLQRGEVSGIDVQSVRTDYVIDPVPFSTQLKVTCSTVDNRPMRVILSDLAGAVVAKGKTDKDGICMLNTASLTNGVYLLSVYDKGKVTYSRKITKK